VLKPVGHPSDTEDERPTNRGDEMRWDVRLAEANLILADMLGAAMTRRETENEDPVLPDRAS
jgi:hypothetical protein